MSKKELTSSQVDRLFFPDHGKLVVNDEGTIVSSIVDAEMDEIKCTFHDDDCVHLSCLSSECDSYIVLTQKNLYDLGIMIDDAKERYEEMYSEEE